MPDPHLVDAAQQTVTDVSSAMLSGYDVVVASPPGAGKTRLITELVPQAVAAGQQVGIIANTNGQAHQLLRRLAASAPELALTFAPGTNRPVPAWLTATPTVTVTIDRDVIAARDVLVSTADKAAYLYNPAKRKTGPPTPPVEVAVLIVDEAWQLPWAKLQRLNSRYQQFVLVGDPGQLDPFSAAPMPARWHTGAPIPLDPAPRGLQAAGQQATRHQLPASWRLPPSAAALVGPTFYPDLPFQAVTCADDRAVELTGGSPAALRAWQQTASSGWGLVELDATAAPRHDPQLATTIVDQLAVLLAARPVVHDEHGTRALNHSDLAVITAHRDQRHTVRSLLDHAGLVDVDVHTANTAQGLEYELTVVWHPLSGRHDPTGFHLDAGRLCVMLSRHRQACLVVSRPGIADLLDRTTLPSSLHLDGRPCPELTGWGAHHRVLEHLTGHQIDG